MNYYYTRRLILFVTLFTVFAGLLFAAETGTIKGTVVDSQTGDPLPGANVVLKEIFHGTATNIQGEFVLTNVPEGTNTLSVSYLGYEEQEVIVEISANETKTIDIVLQVMSIQGEEAVITAQAYGQRAAINQQLAANTVTNVVSSEKIQELPDANAAEALGRLPGVSLKRNAGEANKVVIRGLSPKYNNVTIEGVKMASTSDYDRSVDLSLVQSEILAGIEVSKSLRADMDADALGGTVNLRLQDAPNTRKINLAAEGGYTNLGEDFGNYKFTGGYSDRFFDKKLGVSLRASHEQKQMPSHSFSAEYQGPWNEQILDETNQPTGEYELLIRTEDITLTEKQQTRNRTNGSFILDYKNDWWDVKFFNLLSIKNDDVLTRTNRQIYTSQGMAASFERNDNQALWETMTRTHSLQNSFTFGTSRFNVDLSTTVADVEMNDQFFPFVDDTRLEVDQDWLVYQDPEVVFDAVGGLDSVSIPNTYLQSFRNSDQNLSDVSYDAKVDYELTYTLFGSIAGKLKAGYKYHELTRTSTGIENFYDLQWGGSVARRQNLIDMYPWIETTIGSQRGVSAGNFIDPDYDPGTFIDGTYELAWAGDVDLLTDMESTLRDSANEMYTVAGVEDYQRDYEASERLHAGYIMTELNIGQKLMLLPGIRYEAKSTEYTAWHIKTASNITGVAADLKDTTTYRENAHWFPSLNMKFKATDIISIQGAVYKSASRPSFRQISPLVIYPTTGNDITSNNPYLEPAIAWNYDLGVSIMQPKLGLLTIYGFYKEVSDLVFVLNDYRPNRVDEITGGPEDLRDRLIGPEYYDPLYMGQQGKTDQPFNNPEKAQIYGLELSWQTNFWYLPGILKGLVLDINYTIMHTTTNYPFFDQVQIGTSTGFPPLPIYETQYKHREGPMEDQPASIINVVLGFDYKGFSGRVSYRYQSNTVEGLDTRYSVFDRYYDTFSLVDLMLKQKITKNISAYANLTNIGNHVDKYFFAEQGNDRPQLPTNSQFYGFRAQLGIKVNL